MNEENNGRIMYACMECDKAFSTKRGLKSHMRYHDPAFAERMSTVLTGRRFSDETRRRMSESASKRRDSDETRRNKSEAQREVWNRPGYKEEFSKRNSGKRHLSDEEKRNLSEKAKERWADPEFHREAAGRIRDGVLKGNRRRWGSGE